MSSRDLEIVAVPGDSPPPGARSVVEGGRRRRWPWAAGGAVALLGALLFPVRSALAHAEVDKLQSAWSVFIALENSRGTLVNRLLAESVSSDAPALRQAAIGVDNEEAERIGGLYRSLPTIVSVDGGARRLRNTIAAAFRQETKSLRSAAGALANTNDALLPSQVDASTVDISAVQTLIDGQRRRFGEDIHDAAASTAALHAADATLARFSHYLDTTTGARLLVRTNFGLRLVDVDRRTDTPVDLGPDTNVVVTGGQLFGFSEHRVFRLPAGVTGPQRYLGPGDAVFSAPREQAVWIVTDDGNLSLRALAGPLLWGPQPFSGVLGAVDAGVIVAGPPPVGLSVVDPRAGKTARSIDTGPEPPDLVAAAGDAVVFTGQRDPDVHVFSVSTGSTRAFAVLGSDALEGAEGAVSPDGRWLATYTVSAQGQATMVIVDLRTGAVKRLADVAKASAPIAIAWMPDSSRLFFTVNEDGATVATWHVGDPGATVLRWRSASAVSIAVLP